MRNKWMLDGYLGLRDWSGGWLGLGGFGAWYSGLGGTPGWMDSSLGGMRVEGPRSRELTPDTPLRAWGGQGRAGAVLAGSVP